MIPLPPPTPVRPSANGLSLHALDWNPAGAPPVLFLHGWLDNCHGFDWLIQALPRAWRSLALDFRGQGQSEHLPPSAYYHFTDYLLDVEATLDALGLDRVHLVGHSMGGGVACAYAAGRPERVRSISLLENLGTRGGSPEDALHRLRGFLDDARKPLRKRTYPTLEEAAARLREHNPGLSEASALYLVRHGTRPTGAGYEFTYDPRVRRLFGMSYDEEQLLSVLGAIRCPVQVIRGTAGYSLPEEVWRPRLERVGSPTPITVEGGHHVHMDSPAEVAGHLERFIAALGSGAG